MPFNLNAIMSDSWNQLGLLLSCISNWDRAISAYIIVLELGKKHQNQQAIASAYGNLGIVYLSKANKTEAKRYRQQSLELYKQLQSPKAKIVQGALDSL